MKFNINTGSTPESSTSTAETISTISEEDNIESLNELKSSLPNEVQKALGEYEGIKGLKESDLILYFEERNKIEDKIDVGMKAYLSGILTGKNISPATASKGSTNQNPGRNGSGNAPSAVGSRESVGSSDVIEDNNGSETISNGGSYNKYKLFLNYLDFKGYDKNSNLYKSIKINLVFLKQDPFLTTYTNKSIKVGEVKYTYKEFLDTFISNNIENIINGRKITNVPNTDGLYKDIHKKIKSLRTEVGNSNVSDSIEHTSILDPLNAMNDIRDKIGNINNMSFNELYGKLDDYIDEDFDYIDIENLKSRLKYFIERSEGGGEKENTLAKYIKEHRKEIIEQLEKRDVLFNQYKKSLKEVKNILDSYKGNIPNDIKEIAEKEMKGLISGMLFINGLHTDNLFSLVERVTPLGASFAYIRDSINEWLAYPLLILFTGGITARYIVKNIRKNIFLDKIGKIKDISDEKIEDKGTKTKIEKFKGLFNKKLDLITIDEINKVIENLSEKGEGREIKEGYEKIEGVFERLKKFRDIKQIIKKDDRFKMVRGKLDINSIFLSDKQFARDIIGKIITSDVKWYEKFVNTGSNIPKAYLGLGSLGRLADAMDLKPLLLGENNKHFSKIHARVNLDNFIIDNNDKLENNFDKLKSVKDIFKNSSLSDDQKEKLIQKVEDWSTKDILKDDAKLVEYNTKIESLKNVIIALSDLSKGDLSKYGAFINTEINTLIGKETPLNNFEADIRTLKEKLDSLNLLESEKSKVTGSLHDTLAERSVTDIEFEKLNKAEIDKWKGVFEKIVTLEQSLDSTNQFYNEYKEAVKDFIKNPTTALKNIDGLISEIEETNKIIKTGDTVIDNKVKSKVGEIIKVARDGKTAISVITENQKIYLEGSDGKGALSDRISGHELESEVKSKVISSYDNKSIKTVELFMDKYNEIKSKINISNLLDKSTFINDLKNEGKNVNIDNIKDIENKFEAEVTLKAEEKAKAEAEEKVKTEAKEKARDRTSQEKIAEKTSGNGGEKIIVITTPEGHKTPEAEKIRDFENNPRLKSNFINKVNLFLQVIGEPELDKFDLGELDTKNEIFNKAGIENKNISFFEKSYKTIIEVERIEGIGIGRIKAAIDGSLGEKWKKIIEAKESGLIKKLEKIGKDALKKGIKR